MQQDAANFLNNSAADCCHFSRVHARLCACAFVKQRLKPGSQHVNWTELNIHTYTHLTALRPGLPGWAGTRKIKPIWILLKQETVSGSGISWALCKSAPRSRQINKPAPHRSVFRGRMPFLPPNQQRQSTGGVALKAELKWFEKVDPFLYRAFLAVYKRQSCCHWNVLGMFGTLKDLNTQQLSSANTYLAELIAECTCQRLVLVQSPVNQIHTTYFILIVYGHCSLQRGSVAKWLACWTQAQKGLGSNRSCDAVG